VLFLRPLSSWVDTPQSATHGLYLRRQSDVHTECIAERCAVWTDPYRLSQRTLHWPVFIPPAQDRRLVGFERRPIYRKFKIAARYYGQEKSHAEHQANEDSEYKTSWLLFACYSLLLARLMGQYCFACCRLSASSVGVVCNERGRSAAAGRVGGRAADNARRDSTVTSLRATPCFSEISKVRKPMKRCWIYFTLILFVVCLRLGKRWSPLLCTRVE